jgi:hypothetical protein
LNLDPRSVDAGVAFSAFIAWTGVVGWIWNVRAIAVNARDDLAEYRADRERHDRAIDERLKRAETTAASVERLADAVKYGADITSSQIKNLSEKLGEHAVFTKEQLADIRNEQKSVRQALSARNTRRSQ